MKPRLTLFSYLIIILFTCNVVQSQNISDPRWNISTLSHSPYKNIPNGSLPPVEIDLHRNMTTRIYHTLDYDFLVPPNIRPFPSNASQKTVDAASMTGNQNIMFASWNSGYYPSSYYGTGFCFTSNGGINWTGSDQMNSSGNNGEPGVWIWSAASPWAGRLGFTVIGSAGISSSYSTNNGSNWSAFVSLGGSSTDMPLSCVDDVTGSPFLGRAYCVWTDFGGTYVNRICGAYSSNGGVSWAGYGPVSPPPVTGHHCQGCDICVGPGGVVYACWTNCITNGQNSTEDSLGFAVSTDGGVSWTGRNNCVDVNGIRAQYFYDNFRIAGFPRMAVDKSGGSRNGWIYVTLSEKIISPARDSADVTLCRSTNGGVNWTHTLINSDTAGNYQWYPSPAVDPSGNIAVGYYDTRGLAFPSIQYYLSFSSNGGNTWIDIQVSDHTFIAGSNGLNGPYIGNYTGMAFGDGKFWPFWMDDYLDPTGAVYQVWTVGITPLAITHNSNELPASFYLYQNYPNPFNPTTKIKFSIPASPVPSKGGGQEVSLKIYDIMGKQVASLIPPLRGGQEGLPPETYEVEWNAANYPSGIYFYRLQAGDYQETRKMVIMK